MFVTSLGLIPRNPSGTRPSECDSCDFVIRHATCLNRTFIDSLLMLHEVKFLSLSMNICLHLNISLFFGSVVVCSAVCCVSIRQQIFPFSRGKEVQFNSRILPTMRCKRFVIEHELLINMRVQRPSHRVANNGAFVTIFHSLTYRIIISFFNRLSPSLLRFDLPELHVSAA